MRVAIADHLGWAIAVTASADHEVVDRRRIELVEPGVSAANASKESMAFPAASRTAGTAAAVTIDPPQTVAPGATRSYTYYAHPEIGETAALVRDWGDVLRTPRLGLFGAIVVGPRGARYTDPTGLRPGTGLGRAARRDRHGPAAGRAGAR